MLKIAYGFSKLKKRNGVTMNSHEDDEIYDNLEDIQPKRSKRTKFRESEDKDSKTTKREKLSSKRSHRQKTIKDDSWPDDDD